MNLRLATILAALAITPHLHAQASAIPSAQTNALPDATQAAPNDAAPNDAAPNDAAHARKLLTQMVDALGGRLWLDRQDWVYYGRLATFYKGQPHEGAPAFEEYYRAEPYGERIILVSHFGVFIATDHKDLAEVWTADHGYEVSYKGKKDLPDKDVQDYVRRRRHSLEVIVHDWLNQPGVLLTYEGTNMVERRLAEQIGILTPSNDAVTLELDEGTHLPLSLSFQWRDPVYKDLNTDVQQFDDYHSIQGIMTPFSITRLHNGDMTGQRFLTSAKYNLQLAPDLFDPDRPLEKKAK